MAENTSVIYLVMIEPGYKFPTHGIVASAANIAGRHMIIAFRGCIRTRTMTNRAAHVRRYLCMIQLRLTPPRLCLMTRNAINCRRQMGRWIFQKNVAAFACASDVEVINALPGNNPSIRLVTRGT